MGSVLVGRALAQLWCSCPCLGWMFPARRLHWLLTAGVCAQEDAQLIELVDQYGPMNWSLIAQQLRSMPPRNGKSCRLRWCASLSSSGG